MVIAPGSQVNVQFDTTGLCERFIRIEELCQALCSVDIFVKALGVVVNKIETSHSYRRVLSPCVIEQAGDIPVLGAFYSGG